MSRLRVLLTGAAGYVAGQLLSSFRERYDLRLIDRRQEDAFDQPVHGVEIVDLFAQETSTLQKFFANIDVVVHLAYQHVRDDDPYSRSYENERQNLDITQRVYQLAMDNAVRRVVVGSSNQAAKWYEIPYFSGSIDRVAPYDYPRPDNFYGWGKAAGEALGFLYACGSLGRQLEVLQVRIVAPRQIDANNFTAQSHNQYIRDLTGYISQRDLQQLFCKSIEAADVKDEHGVPFHIFYGVSNNTRKFWSITNARKVIGYQPQDDSEISFADDISRMLRRSE